MVLTNNRGRRFEWHEIRFLLMETPRSVPQGTRMRKLAAACVASLVVAGVFADERAASPPRLPGERRGEARRSPGSSSGRRE